MNRDPVCGMDVVNNNFNSEIDGKQFFFCSEGRVVKKIVSEGIKTHKANLWLNN